MFEFPNDLDKGEVRMDIKSFNLFWTNQTMIVTSSKLVLYI